MPLNILIGLLIGCDSGTYFINATTIEGIETKYTRDYLNIVSQQWVSFMVLSCIQLLAKMVNLLP